MNSFSPLFGGSFFTLTLGGGVEELFEGGEGNKWEEELFMLLFSEDLGVIKGEGGWGKGGVTKLELEDWLFEDSLGGSGKLNEFLLEGWNGCCWNCCCGNWCWYCGPGAWGNWLKLGLLSEVEGKFICWGTEFP